MKSQEHRPSKRFHQGRILVNDEPAPSRRLLLKMVELQSSYQRSIPRIMSGIAVSEEEWNTVHYHVQQIGTRSTLALNFAWDQ
jgi:hypothetical protein